MAFAFVPLVLAGLVQQALGLVQQALGLAQPAQALPQLNKPILGQIRRRPFSPKHAYVDAPLM